MEHNVKLDAVIAQFNFQGELKECAPFGHGHINDTYRLVYDMQGETKSYILQRMNINVFKQPLELMENITNVTNWLKGKIVAEGGDALRETLTVVPTGEGKQYCIDADGNYWRVFLFIDAICYEQAESEELFYESAVAFGHFQSLLADYPAETLHETIKDFHNTKDRYRKFEAAVQADACGRAADVQEEIKFYLERKALAATLCDAQEAGELPLRVTHNDTKLNNIMFDEETGKGICVIDLDTVMPGLSVNDFGDSIRFGASTAAEDETDLSKVSCDLHLFEVYVKGFIEGCNGALTEKELDMLPMGAILMTYECGIRFLTDYLEGDHYFKIQREQHNLDRSRTQLTLVKDMEEKLPQMNAIVDKYR